MRRKFRREPDEQGRRVLCGENSEQVRRKPLYGCAKDKIWIADDFDAPLDDFKEYI
ncbi:MAG: DUF2281 domain-containing protein [Clostridiales bacterium]|nr:DUF2281 domain-containing protein [Clostridiales bacterium]